MKATFRKHFYFLFILSILSCSKKDVIVVTANVPPTISYNPLGEGKASFTAVGANTVNYKWDFGDNSPNATDSNPIHQYKFNGDYKVILIAQVKVNNDIVQHTVILNIQITDIKDQTPSFKYSSLGDGKLLFELYAPYIKSVKWDFGDKSTESTENNPTHIYRFNGDYNVRIIVEAEAKDGNKQFIVTQKVTVSGLKDATPKFTLKLNTDNKTVVVSNPAPYLKKVSFEFIDPYEVTVKSDLNNATYGFPWNIESTIKMTALVEAKNGDTTYIDSQTVKITGNPKPNAPNVYGDGFSIEIIPVEKYQKIEFYPGDIAQESPFIINGSMKQNERFGRIPYDYPHRGPFNSKIRVTNPNGTSEFSKPINGPNVSFIPDLVIENAYLEFQSVAITPDGKVKSTGRYSIKSKIYPSNSMHDGDLTFIPKSLTSSDNLLRTRFETQFPPFNLSNLKISTFNSSVYVATPTQNDIIIITPKNYKYLYIGTFNGSYICTNKVTYKNLNPVGFSFLSSLTDLNRYYKTNFATYEKFIQYFYSTYIFDTNSWIQSDYIYPALDKLK